MNKRTLVPHPTNPDLVGVHQNVVGNYLVREDLLKTHSLCRWCPDYEPCRNDERTHTCKQDKDGWYYVWVPKHVGVAAVLEAEEP